jgi:hypothetical protein
MRNSDRVDRANPIVADKINIDRLIFNDLINI